MGAGGENQLISLIFCLSLKPAQELIHSPLPKAAAWTQAGRTRAGFKGIVFNGVVFTEPRSTRTLADLTTTTLCPVRRNRKLFLPASTICYRKLQPWRCGCTATYRAGKDSQSKRHSGAGSAHHSRQTLYSCKFWAGTWYLENAAAETVLLLSPAIPAVPIPSSSL